MTVTVAFYEDPAEVLRVAGDFLVSDPIAHQLILSLLHARVAHPEPGRYWVASDSGTPSGVVFQSPLHFAATVTPMLPAVIEPMVAAISESGVTLPAVTGEVATVSRFAGHWTEYRNCGATAGDAQRIYEVREVQPPNSPSGKSRQAVAADRDLLCKWVRRFAAEVGQNGGDGYAAGLVDRLLPAGQFWVWQHGQPRCMAAHSAPVMGVTRLQAVYTPPRHRNHGYAAACVADLSSRLLHSGLRCILYTELANATANSVYRRIGYRAAAEIVRYSFH